MRAGRWLICRAMIKSEGFAMKKQWWISVFVIPNLRSAAAYLRAKDENSTGGDDEAAEAIDYAVARLEKWLAEPEVK